MSSVVRLQYQTQSKILSCKTLIKWGGLAGLTDVNYKVENSSPGFISFRLAKLGHSIPPPLKEKIECEKYFSCLIKSCKIPGVPKKVFPFEISPNLRYKTVL